MAQTKSGMYIYKRQLIYILLVRLSYMKDGLNGSIPMQNQAIFEQKNMDLRKTDQLLTTEPILNRGMNVQECKIICTANIIPLRE
jgi:hypothetical protein